MKEYLRIEGKYDGQHEEDGEDAVLCPWLSGLQRWQEEKAKGDGNTAGKAWDDVTGGELDPAEVEKAREAEMEFIRNMKVYENVPRRWAHR